MNTTRKRTTPGEILLNEYMEPMGLSVRGLAELTGYTPRYIGLLLTGGIKIKQTTAIRLARVLNTSPDFWLNCQEAADADFNRRKTHTG